MGRLRGWDVVQARFYTGVPDAHQNRRWYDFWNAKLLAMKNRGVHVYQRPLVYRRVSVPLADGSIQEVVTSEEKGIDVRIAIDVVRLALRRSYDVALLFSRDQDLSELCGDIREIAREQGRWIKIASAYPWSAACPKGWCGIRNSDWIRIERDVYDACLDPQDYRKPSA